MPEIASAKKSSPINEDADLSDIRQSELSVMQDKFFNLRDEIRTRLETLTLVQLEIVANKVRETVDGFSMNQ